MAAKRFTRKFSNVKNCNSLQFCPCRSMYTLGTSVQSSLLCGPTRCRVHHNLQPGTIHLGKPRVIIADDHVLVAEGLQKLLESEYEIVGRATDGRQLLELATQLVPDIVILDLSMPVLNGYDAGRQLHEVIPQTKLIVLTMNQDADVASESLEKWASAFVLKSSAARELSSAIRDVLRGHRFVSPPLREAIARARPTSPLAGARSLTQRQREVLQLLAEGRTMKQVAQVLGVTPRTVAFHKYKIMEAFGLKSNSDLVRLAIKSHLIPAS